MYYVEFLNAFNPKRGKKSILYCLTAKLSQRKAKD